MKARETIEFRRPTRSLPRSLAGSLKEFGKRKPFPSEGVIADALRKGLGERG